LRHRSPVGCAGLRELEVSEMSRRATGADGEIDVGCVERASFAEISRFVVRGLKARFRDQKTELAVVRRHIRRGDIVCDVGANKGSFTYWLSRWSREGRVVAFEPQPELARRLARVCASLRLHNVKIEATAVYSDSGRRDLLIPNGHQPGASLNRIVSLIDECTTVSVPVVSLDEYFGEKERRISVLKVDVEGAELGVFQGAERILRQDSPLLLFECESRHLDAGSVRDVFSYLESLGYEGHFVLGDRLCPTAVFRESIHQRQDGAWFWKEKDYCNNFVFTKRP
jgi:FkbM family methyltransferase